MIGKQYEYDRMAACEKELWWYRCLHDITLEKIKKHSSDDNPAILDAGCGTGGLLHTLHQNGYKNCRGFDLSEDAVKHAFTTYGFAVQTLNILDADKAYEPEFFDIIISNDVICLMPDLKAKEAFDKLSGLLKPGGLMLLNLPAGKLFRGTHDIAVGIQKRYSRQAVEMLVTETVTIREMIAWPFFLSPLIFAVRLFQRTKLIFNKKLSIVSDVSLPPPFINKFFYFISRIENKILLRKPWGSSLFIVFQKKS